MNKFPFCSEHQDSEQEFLLIGENGYNLYCSQCIYKLQDEQNQVNYKEIIHLKIIKNNPEEFILRIFPKKHHKILDNFTQIIQLQNLFKQCLNQIAEFKKVIDVFYDSVCFKLKEAQEIQQNMRKELSKVIQLDQFIMNLSELQKTTGQNSTDDIQQIENSFFTYLKKFQSNSQELFEQLNEKPLTQYTQFENLKMTFLKTFSELETFVEDQNDRIQLKLSSLKYSSSIIDYNYFQQLMKIVEQKQNRKITSIKRIFEGSQNGLTLDGLWKAIKDKSQLLMIFKSKNSSVFGVFTPCRWTDKDKQFTDTSMISFIFSQTLQEIYSIKYYQNNQTQYFGYQRITFGGTYNNINLYNFQDGYSQLGIAYEAKGKDSTKKSSYLFGGLKPEIIVCEVYELL